MDLENEFLKIGMVKSESTEATKAKDIGICVKEDSEHCSRYLILDERCKKAEERCIVLESEMQTKMSVIQVLQRQMKEFDERITQKANGGDKATAVEEGEKCVIYLTDDVENDKVSELMVENKVLNCEKRKAESEVGFWKAKYEGLELRITSLESKLSSAFEEPDVGLASPGSSKKLIIQRETVQEECYGVTTPLIDTTLHGNARQLNRASSEILQEKRQGCSSRTRKQLNFGEGTPDKMAPATPAGGPIDISDSSDNGDEEGSSLGRRALRQSMNKTHGFADLGGGTASYKEELSSSNGMTNIGKSEIEDDITHGYLVTPSLSASKRKSASHIVHSDSESDAEDNVPLRRLRKSCSKEACKRVGGAVNRDMDTVARKSKGEGIPKKHSHGNSKGSKSKTNHSIPTTGGVTDDDITPCYQVTPSSLASKRKRASRIVHSDSESDADDNVPLRRLRKSCSKDASKRAGGNVNRDMDTAARKSKGRGISKKYSCGNPKGSENKNNRGIPTTTECLKDDETEEGESDSEGESLNGFIVSDSESDVSIVDKSSQEDESESDEKSEGNVDYGEIMSRIGRRKDHLIKWEFEADMLSAFGKNPELCMQAVCTLYRQQTSDEKRSKSTIHQNQRGFSHADATRGTILGEFLTDEDPEGGLKKSVEELLEFQSKGLELCRTLATRYSKQLFAMYENKEDPLWPALCTNC